MHSLFAWILAQASAPPGGGLKEPTTVNPNLGSSGLRDVLIVICAASAMGLALFLWAYLTRRSRRRRAANSRGMRMIERRNGEDADGKRRKLRKRRRQHPDNLPRNPTLAEAGGLPPLRPEESELPQVEQAAAPPPTPSAQPPSPAP